MQIGPHTLPDSFQSCIQSGRLKRARGSWQLRADRDAYGNFLETDLGQVYATLELIQLESSRLPEGFPADQADITDDYASEPGFIPYITDFTHILEFAIAGDGSPFCFDYRGSLAQPSIIWWDDTYWRCLAPSFDAFLALFDLQTDA